MRQQAFICAAVLMVMSSFVLGCQEKKEEVKSVAWYKAPENRAALEEKLAYCRGHKELQGVDQNCVNAESAKATMGSFEKVREPEVPNFSGAKK